MKFEIYLKNVSILCFKAYVSRKLIYVNDKSIVINNLGNQNNKYI